MSLTRKIMYRRKKEMRPGMSVDSRLDSIEMKSIMRIIPAVRISRTA